MPVTEICVHNLVNEHHAPNHLILSELTQVLSAKESVTFGYVNFIFQNTLEHTKLNIKHLNHHFETDILTFDLSDNHSLNTDIYINVDMAAENANTYQVTLKDELLRLCIHGLLHMSGYNDHTESEKVEMRKLEDYYLNVSCET